MTPPDDGPRLVKPPTNGQEHGGQPAPLGEHEAIDVEQLEGYAASDVGLAETFAQEHHDAAAYVGAWRRWHVWDGTRWSRDESGHAIELLKRTMKLQLWDTSNNGTRPELGRATVMRMTSRLLANLRLREVLACASSIPTLAKRPEDFDTQAGALNVANGTLALQVGTLQPHDAAKATHKLAGLSPRNGEALACAGTQYGDDDPHYQHKTHHAQSRC